MKKLFGFALIELLIVIAIMGILATLLTTNFINARDRAQDSKKKSNLQQLKTALNLYHNDYGKYPDSANASTNIAGCGTLGSSPCPATSFTGRNVYLQNFPKTASGQNDFRYYSCSGGDDFRLKINLTNTSDPDIAESQLRCPAACGTTYTAATDYVLCAD